MTSPELLRIINEATEAMNHLLKLHTVDICLDNPSKCTLKRDVANLAALFVRNVRAIPRPTGCPNCGFYQEKTSRVA